MRVITFNTQATQAVQARTGAKLRLDVREGNLCIRPTDRKAGPHVLTEIEAKGKTVSVQVTDKQIEKLGAGDILAVDATFGLVADKYGWFALQAAPAADTAGLVEGAEATVTEA